MGKKRRTLLAVALALVSCSTPVVPTATPAQHAQPLRLHVVTAALPLAIELTNAYRQTRPDAVFDVREASQATALDRLARDPDAYLITPFVSDDDRWVAPLAQDAMTLIVHPLNPTADVSLAQARALMGGGARDWRAISGFDAPVHVIARDPVSGSRAFIESALRIDADPRARLAPSSAAVVDLVADIPGAIGYVTTAHADAGGRVRALSLEGVAPSSATIRDGRYPLRLVVYAVGNREPDGETLPGAAYRAFFAWVQSPEGQAVVARRAAPLMSLPR